MVLRVIIEQKTCFTNLQGIKFYGFDRLLTKVVTVGFGHVRDRTAVWGTTSRKIPGVGEQAANCHCFAALTMREVDFLSKSYSPSTFSVLPPLTQPSRLPSSTRIRCHSLSGDSSKTTTFSLYPTPPMRFESRLPVSRRIKPIG